MKYARACVSSRNCVAHMPAGPVQAQHSLAMPPPRAAMLKDIDTLIPHFLNASWGAVIPAGEAAVTIEAAKGVEHLCADQRWRHRPVSRAHPAHTLLRASANHSDALQGRVSGGPDRHYRQHRFRDGRCRPLKHFLRPSGEGILALMAREPMPRAACINALRYVQQGRRFISDAILAEIAAMLGMSAAELDEVATFYNLIFRRPVGEQVILLCDSITCWMLGQPQLTAHLRGRLGIKPGETSADGKYTLLPIVCLGHCDHAPAMLLGETLHGDVDTEKLDALLCLEPV